MKLSELLKEEDTFNDRITKIQTEGLSRNRIYFEFIDDKKDFDDAKKSFYNAITLVLSDGLITLT